MFLQPHSVCLALDHVLLWLHVTADAVTALAYYSIPAALMVFAMKRRGLRYRWLVLLFAAFVVACGTTHIFGIVTIWEPFYWAQGMVKAFTALVSIVTAVLIWLLIPRLVALPSPADLEREVQERKQVEAEVRRINAGLEERVAQRTADLQRAKDEADRANQAKSRFLAAASHDLRQPFQALRLFLEVLQMKTSGGPLQPVVDNAVQALEGGEGLLRALLDISILQAGTVVPRPVPIPVNDLLRQIQLEWGSQAARKGVELRVIPSTATITTDPILVQRLVRNLVANALRYTDMGRIVVGCRRESGGLRIEVWDSGIGIPDGARLEIFEEFTQLGNPERDRSKGLGLGLAIVRRLAVLLGLRITLDSCVGRGSVFRVHVPHRSGVMVAGA